MWQLRQNSEREVYQPAAPVRRTANSANDPISAPARNKSQRNACHVEGQPRARPSRMVRSRAHCRSPLRRTRCHQIPDEKFDLGGGVTFSHDLAYEKGVDCANCHGDVISGSGEVPRERCLVCHNREDDLKRIGDDAFMHQKHVTDHKIDCLDCHLAIQHSLEKEKLGYAANDCKSCHPDHHHEQVEMLRGVGAKSMPGHPSSMVAARADCLTCHRVKQVSSTGTVLWKASAQMCSLCHDAATVKDLEAYHAKLREALPELESGVLRVRKALESAKLPADRQKVVVARLEEVQHDLDFLRVANDIHNLHYASKLFQLLVDRVADLCREIKVAEPKVKLPPPLGGATPEQPPPAKKAKK